MPDALQVQASFVFDETAISKAEGVLWMHVTDRNGDGVRGLSNASFSLFPLQDTPPSIKDVADYSGEEPNHKGPYGKASDPTTVDYPVGLYRLTLSGGPMAYAIVGQFSQILKVEKYPPGLAGQAAIAPETGLGMFTIVKTK